MRFRHTSISMHVGALFALLAVSPGLLAQPASVPELKKALDAQTGLRRRQVARRLIEHGQEAKTTILILAKDDDVVIRRNATRVLRGLLGEDALPLYREAMKDPSPLVRMVAVEELMAYEPRTEAVTAILTQAASDPDDEVRKLAGGAFWTFHRDYITLRKRPNWDHAIDVIDAKLLPSESWRFRTDPGRAGHVQEWFAPGLDESDWHETIIGKWWHDALPKKVGHFEGVAWYRIVFAAPEKPDADFNEAVLHFTAVDESTWVWVNGHYAGEHDMGPGGWNVPFDIEVGAFIKWGQPNQITVRVLNTAGAGGIYKPVEFQVLK